MTVFHVKYKVIVFLYEDKCRDPLDALAKTAEDLPGSLRAVLVHVENSVSLEGSMLLGIPWPCDVYKKHLGEDAPRELVKTYTHNGQNVRGVLREPSHGQPIGCIQLTQEVAETVSKVVTASDSNTAPRGEAQALETYEALRSRASVSVGVLGRSESDHPHSLGLTFKLGKGALKDEDADTFLNDLWSSPNQGMLAAVAGRNAGTPKRSSSSTSLQASASSSKPSPGPSEKKTKKNSSGDAAARSAQLGQSETVVLKCRLLVQNLESDETVMQQSVKKIDGICASIKGRMSDKIMEHYAADYGEPWVVVVGTVQATCVCVGFDVDFVQRSDPCVLGFQVVAAYSPWRQA